MNSALLAIIALIASFNAAAVDDYYMDRARGWFWREEPLEPPKPTKPRPPTPQPAAPAIPAEPETFSVEWFRKNLDGIRHRAIDDPSKENVLALLSAERVMRDKATRYAMVTQQVLRESPWLDENVRRPTSAQGEAIAESLASSSLDANAPLLAQQTAIWFFYRSDCPYCKEQVAPLRYLQDRYGFRIIPISLDGAPLPGNPFPNWKTDSGQAASLNVAITPSMFIVRPPNNYAALGYGLTPAMELLTRAIDIGSSQGWLAPQAREALFQAKDDTSYLNSSGRVLDGLTPQNPAAINARVKQLLKGR